MSILIIRAAISSGLATLGFAILFNIKRDKLFYAALTGAIGGILYKVCFHYGLGEYLSNFIAAIGLSLCSEIFARYCKTPVSTFLVCALIPLVPGGFLFRMILCVMEGTLSQAIEYSIVTISIALVLTIGILFVSTMVQLYYKARRH
ncbi:MAG: threonine/serine exporter family protein [Bacillota bacterium]|nr:threonine/serine exporter family protein [Bacillota bacterium]